MSESELLRELIRSIDLAIWGKQYHFEQDDGSWYLRKTGEYKTLEEAVGDVIDDVNYFADPVY